MMKNDRKTATVTHQIIHSDYVLYSHFVSLMAGILKHKIMERKYKKTLGIFIFNHKPMMVNFPLR